MCKTRGTHGPGVALSMGFLLLLCPPGRAQDPKPTGKAEEAVKFTAGRQGTAGFSPLEFQALANQKQNWSFGGALRPADKLAALTIGEHRLLGIPFQIGDKVLQVGSKRLPEKPE